MQKRFKMLSYQPGLILSQVIFDKFQEMLLSLSQPHQAKDAQIKMI